MKKLLTLILCAAPFTAMAELDTSESPNTSNSIETIADDQINELVANLKHHFEGNCYTMLVADKTEVSYSYSDVFDKDGNVAFKDMNLESDNYHDVLVVLDLQHEALQARVESFYNEMEVLKSQHIDKDFSFINKKIDVYRASDEELIGVYKDLAGMVIAYKMEYLSQEAPEITFNVDKYECPSRTIDFYDHTKFKDIVELDVFVLEKAINALIKDDEAMFFDNRLTYIEL